jgi:LL-diaminopimelate aminotransferase
MTISNHYLVFCQQVHPHQNNSGYNMVKINSHYLKLKAGYLFPEISRRVKEFSANNPKAKIIKLGIGDVTQPLPQAAINAGKAAFDSMGKSGTFRGYGPEQGYEFLRQAVVDHDFTPHGVNLDADEVFISDGSKCDTSNIQEIFAHDSKIAVPDPVYPVYVDTNVMAGRTGEADENGRFANLCYLQCNAENGFLPDLPKERVDLIYLCYPNNPTGVVATKDELKIWVDYAREMKSIILFDAAYEAFITDSDLPHSIYEIEGAKECAIEFRSFSKTAGFTGTRLAYTIVPKTLMGTAEDGSEVSIHQLWNRRQCTKFNAVSYPIQKAGLACYSPEGQEQVKALVNYYLGNAKIISEGLTKLGFEIFGGEHSPYIWLKSPNSLGSWEFFDKLLNEAHVVGTPGAGFGACGEGYFRLSAFGSKENVEEAIERIQTKLSL